MTQFDESSVSDPNSSSAAIWALPDLECVDPVLELSGVNERPQDVVLEVAET